ncbi:MAG: PLP-dependent aminotransferase family protein [Streptococcaceae bacterium]|jgi:2-aminoadipate transaminase|nr:PLP-dependent aminotransferase family protein [Streptococcaceae bacterium]MCH4178063.1 PLP-dependent aminotransferase family protein [Streptococcaceae bacterium]
MYFELAKRMSGLEVSKLRQELRKNMERKDTIPFGFGNPAMESYPVETLKEISDVIYENEPEKFLKYGQTSGFQNLRISLLDRLNNNYSLKHDNHEVVISSGSSQAMDLIVKILCNEGDIVICESQTFNGCVNAIRSYNAIPEGIPMDESGESIDLEILEERLKKDTQKKIKMIYTIPTFHNPLGTSMPIKKREKLVELANKYKIFIFEDDPYGDLIYSGEMLPKLKSFDKEGWVIFVGSFSKNLAPAARIAYVYAHKDITEPFIAAKGDADTHTNMYWQCMADEFIRNFRFDDHIQYLKELYGKKCQLMIKKLNKYCRPHLSFIDPKGGFFITCKMDSTINHRIFMEKLLNKKVIVVPGNLMSVNGTGFEDNFRLSFASPTEEEICQGIKLIGEALEESKY